MTDKKTKHLYSTSKLKRMAINPKTSPKTRAMALAELATRKAEGEKV